MEYGEFMDNVVAELKDIFDDDAEVVMQETMKANEIRREGVVIKTKNGAISPIIYMDVFYDKYNSGKLTFDACIGEIVDIRRKYDVSVNVEDILDSFATWDSVKSRVYPLLISTQKNQELIKSLVSTAYLDLSVIYIIRGGFFADDEDILGHVKIEKDMVENWGISKSDVHEAAMDNLRREEYKVVDIKEMFKRFGVDDDIEVPDNELLVLTNQVKMYAAAGVLEPQILVDRLGDRDYFVIPSSIHELMFVPAAGNEVAALNRMIREVNETSVSLDERLSDHVYFYSGATGEINIAA